MELVQSDILWHPTKMYGPKVYMFIKIKPDILCNQTHFTGPLVCRIKTVSTVSSYIVRTCFLYYYTATEHCKYWLKILIFFPKFEYLLILSQCTIFNNLNFFLFIFQNFLTTFSTFTTPQGSEILNEKTKNSTYLRHL